MSHHDYVYPGCGWYNGYGITAADFLALQTGLVSLLNGDGGGVYSPSAPIIISGAGVWICGSCILAQGATVASDAAVPIAFGDSDYPMFGGPGLAHVAQTRTIVESCIAFQPQRDWTLFSGAPPCAPAAARLGARGTMPIEPVNGSTFASVTLSFVVTGAHGGGLPSFISRMRVCQVSALGVITPLVFQGGDVDGFIPLAAPGSGSAWHDGGAVQTCVYTITPGAERSTTTAYTAGEFVQPTITEQSPALSNGFYYECTTAGTTSGSPLTGWPTVIGETIADGSVVWTCAGANVVIDEASFTYFVEVCDESGTNAAIGNIFQTVALAFEFIADGRPS